MRTFLSGNNFLFFRFLYFFIYLMLSFGMLGYLVWLNHSGFGTLEIILVKHFIIIFLFFFLSVYLCFSVTEQTISKSIGISIIGLLLGVFVSNLFLELIVSFFNERRNYKLEAWLTPFFVPLINALFIFSKTKKNVQIPPPNILDI